MELCLKCLVAGLSLALMILPAAALQAVAEPLGREVGAPGSADRLRDGLREESMRQLVSEVLERNPVIARARHRAAAAAVRAPQVNALPDPEVALTLFAWPAETRVGPQRLSATVAQQLPWFGKLALRERAALAGAAAAAAEVESLRLRLLTQARRLVYELSFLAEHTLIVEEERQHLLRHEEVARARYSAGMGLQQEVLKIQADITRAETRLVEIEARRQGLLASLNSLRDRPTGHPVEPLPIPSPHAELPSLDALRQQALQQRPELAAARAEIAHHQALVELAGKASYPDLKVGLGYTVVGRRSDAPGRVEPPPDNGDDILALSVGAKLPIRKRKLEAATQEAVAMHSAAEDRLRQVHAEIESQLGDPATRLPLVYRQWTLFENVLLAQAEEALSSSEAAYTTGKLNALDLLEAEHVLFEVRMATVRARADYAVALAELEGAIGGTIGRAEGGISQ